MGSFSDERALYLSSLRMPEAGDWTPPPGHGGATASRETDSAARHSPQREDPMPAGLNVPRFAFLVLTLTAIHAASAAAQAERPRPWTFTAAFTGFHTGSSSGWLFGPELSLRRDVGAHWGVGLRASLPVLDAEPYADDGAAAIDLGPTYTIRSAKAEFGLSAGPTAFLVGDGGELLDAGIGAYADAHATAWFTPGLGAVVGGTLRLANDGDAYPSLSAGLALRF